MKIMFLTSLAALALAFLGSLSQADSKIVYSRGANEEIDGSIQFPDYGAVPSDQICLSKDSQLLRTLAPAETKEVCVESSVDHSDSTHPVVVCHKSETVHLPERWLQVPVTVTQEGCVKSHVDHSDSTHPVTICDEMGLVQVSQSLTYRIYTYSPSDYRHESPIDVRTEKIGFCQ